MAIIDKTYVKSLEEYKMFIDWAKDKVYQGAQGTTFKVMDYVYSDWTLDAVTEYFNRENAPIAILNTSWSIDYFLIKDCPFDFVQERMKEVYGEEYYMEVKNGISKYDTFKRNEIVSTKVKVISYGNFGKKKYLYRDKGKKKVIDYWIEVDHDNYSLSYHSPLNIWVLEGYELINAYSWSNVCHKKIKSIKALIKQILKWRLPKGTIVKWCGEYVGDDIILQTY